MDPNSNIFMNSFGLSLSKLAFADPANVYDIAGLDPFTEYLFTFVAGNPTGESDPLEREQETVEGWSPPADEVARHAQLASPSAAFSGVN